MFDGRVPDPITRVGPSRDRPFEATHFDRVEAARDAGDHGARARQKTPRRPAVPAPSQPAPEPPTGHDPAETRRVGTHVDVRA
jgi:hypothetical protein